MFHVKHFGNIWSNATLFTLDLVGFKQDPENYVYVYDVFIWQVIYKVPLNFVIVVF